MKSSRTALQILMISVLSIAFVSCEKEETDLSAQADDQELAIFNLLEASGESDSEGNKRKGAPKPSDQSIAALAGAGGFNELVNALVFVDSELGTELVKLFSEGTDQYTVFAPNDEAFKSLYTALGANEVTDLDPQLVLNVLLYHVTEGRRASNSVVPPRNPRTIETLLGATFKVNSNLTINAVGSNAVIITRDISASNGIIHAIDTVLLPIVP